MPVRPSQTSSRPGVLLALAILAALAGLAALYLRATAADAAEAAEAAARRLAEDRDLAERYRRASSENLVICENLAEAQSSDFIPDALKRNGIAGPTITYGEAEEGGGRFDKVKTTIQAEPASLKSLVDFLRDVEKNRPQLTLLEAKLTREGNADLWRCDLTYGALIPAKSRN